MLRVEDYWVWDSWVADDGEHFHLFFLKAPRALGDPDLRHVNARVGHATSTDLVEWMLLPDVLGPTQGAWDDLAIWTGSVVQGDDGLWRMFYTAISTRDRGSHAQRIGLVESPDLMTWHRPLEEPIVEVDPVHYRTLDRDPTASETWRDPFVFRDLGGDGWHMLLTARALRAQVNDDGVLAHARSHDLTDWSIGRPLGVPGAGFGQLEVPQVRLMHGRHLLVFTCHPDEQTDERRTRFGPHCTWSLPGDSALGPWDFAKARPFTAEPDLFAAPLVRRRDGSWALIGFRNTDPAIGLDLEIIDPIPVTLDEAGYLAAVR